MSHHSHHKEKSKRRQKPEQIPALYSADITGHDEDDRTGPKEGHDQPQQHVSSAC